MENASKALIIAGAILISILLISLGIMIYNQAGDIINNNQMDELAITQFNQKFTQYQGKRSGSQVKSLLQQVISSNANEENSDKLVTVTIDGTTFIDGSSPENAMKYANGAKVTDIKSTSKYDIEMNLSTDSARAGLVESITITKATGTTSGGGGASTPGA